MIEPPHKFGRWRALTHRSTRECIPAYKFDQYTSQVVQGIGSNIYDLSCLFYGIQHSEENLQRMCKIIHEQIIEVVEATFKFATRVREEVSYELLAWSGEGTFYNVNTMKPGLPSPRSTEKDVVIGALSVGLVSRFRGDDGSNRVQLVQKPQVVTLSMLQNLSPCNVERYAQATPQPDGLNNIIC
jgi:hypothetical protein